MRAKFIYEFERGIDPKAALGIGRVGKIKKFFRDLDIEDRWYEITPDEVIFKYGALNLYNANVTWLPDGLKINGWLNLKDTPIAKLPNGLSVGSNLYLSGTNITELPNNLVIGEQINVGKNQKELIKFIKSSIYANKLRIRD